VDEQAQREPDLGPFASWGAIRDGRIVAVVLLGAIAIWLGRLAIGAGPDGLWRISLAATGALAGMASIGVLIGIPLLRRLGALFAGLMATFALLGAVVAPVALILSPNNPDRQWQWGFGYLLLLATAVYLIWSLSVSPPGRPPPRPPRRLLFSAPLVLGALLAALTLGGDSSARAMALPEFRLAPPEASLLHEGGRANESGIWGTVSAWAGRTYASHDEPDAIIAYYARELADRGWIDVGVMRTTGDDEWQTWERGGFRYQVMFRCGFEPQPGCTPADQFEVRIYVP
jgi:hypothetical protein